jgi:hypothetical protein
VNVLNKYPAVSLAVCTNTLVVLLFLSKQTKKRKGRRARSSGGRKSGRKGRKEGGRVEGSRRKTGRQTDYVV